MRWRLLGVLLLATTAGCGSLADRGTDTPTVTPAPVPTASPTPDEPRGHLAPGLHARGVTDSARLARSHVEVTTNVSYVWRSSESASHHFRNSTVNTSESQAVTVEDGSTYHREIDQHETVLDGQLARLDDYEEYGDGDAVYRKWETEDGPVFRRNESLNGNPVYADLAATEIRRYLDLEDATVSRVDGGEDTYYEVVGTRSTLPRFGPLDSYRARAIVRADGFVRSLDVTFSAGRDNERIDVRYGFTYQEVGTANVTEPEWVPEARKQFDD